MSQNSQKTRQAQFNVGRRGTRDGGCNSKSTICPFPGAKSRHEFARGMYFFLKKIRLSKSSQKLKNLNMTMRIHEFFLFSILLRVFFFFRLFSAIIFLKVQKKAVTNFDLVLNKNPWQPLVCTRIFSANFHFLIELKLFCFF